MQKIRKEIDRKNHKFLITAFLLVGFIIGAVLLITASGQFTNSLEDMGGEIPQKIKSTQETYLRKNEALLKTVAVKIQELKEENRRNINKDQLEKVINNYGKILEVDNAKIYAVIDNKYYTADNQENEQDYTKTEWYQKVKETNNGEIIYTNAKYSSQTKEPIVTAAMKIAGTNDILAIDIFPERIATWSDIEIFPKGTSYYITDAEGNIIHQGDSEQNTKTDQEEKHIDEIYSKLKIKEEEIIYVNENDSLYDVLEMANKKQFSNYPIVNNDGKCLGIFRLSTAENNKPKKVILVDHNEKEQSVIGLDEAEIVEIVDHHKIGNIGTSMPINFRNMTVGCTETILYLIYKESNVEIPKYIAGLMLSGIISDTLLLTSPTTTDLDKKALEALAKIAEVDYREYGMEMFKAGSSLEGKTIGEIIHGDFKNFTIDNQKLGIGQVSTMSTDELMSKKEEIIAELNNMHRNEDYKATALFITDILKNGSYILFNEDSKDVFAGAFGVEDIEEAYFFEGMVSRKKQIVPKLMNYLDK